MFLGSVKGAFLALVIIFMFLGWLFQTMNRIKQGIEKNKRIRRKDKLSSQHNSLEQESAADFFARMENEKKAHQVSKKKKKPVLQLKPEHKTSVPAAPLSSFENQSSQSTAYHEPLSSYENTSQNQAYELPRSKTDRKMTDKKASKKAKNIVDKKNLKSLRNAIIINEVLGRPKAYEL